MIKIFLVQGLILITFSGFAQKGPGGVGDNDGTSNLSLWLDAGKITGVTDGGPVNSWLDQSGNGYNAAAAPKAPSYSLNGGGNGQPALSFLHNDQQGMRITGNPEVKPTNELSVFVIGNMVNGPGSRDPFISANSDNNDNDGYAIRQDNNVDRMVLFVDDLGNNNKYSPAYNLNEVWSMVFNTTDNMVYTYKSEDGNTFNFSGTITYDRDGNGPNQDVHIGSGWDNSNYAYFLTGQIQEVILFDVAINDAQRIIISNYLAAKYAISLANNDVYDEDDNGEYDFDVAGIGRKDASNIHDDAQGTGLIRVLNPTGLENDEFLMWGQDGGIARGVETSDVPAGVEARFDRVWRASEVNTSGTAVNVGDIDMRFDLSGLGPITASDLRLLVDADGVFSNAIVDPAIATHLGGNIYNFAGVSSIANNQRFTIATADVTRTPLVEVPGGVAPNLALWLKANDGTSTTTDGSAVSLWTDHSGNNNDVSQATAVAQPLFRDNTTANINFNPVVDFDGANDILLNPSGILGSGTYSDINIYSVLVTDVVQRSYIFEELCSPLHISVVAPWDNDTYYWDAGGNTSPNGNRLTIDWGGIEGRPYLWSNLYSNTSGQTVSGLKQIIERNGLDIKSDDFASSFTGTNSQFNLASNLIRYHDGKIAEFIVYLGAIDAAQHNQIESYLAIKYGITLDNSAGGTAGDYVTSDGTTFWDADADPAYHNDIISIGRDDKSALYQKQSIHHDDSLRIYIDALAVDNTSNTGTISNDVSFIAIGHDGGVQQAREMERPWTVIKSRFEREWKITNTNFDETFSLEIEWDSLGPFDITQIRLLVDDDGDFSNAQVLGPSDGLTFSVGSIIVSGISTAHIPKNSTRFITIGSINRGVPLPIELVSFEATVNEDDYSVELDWQTAAEIDNDFFTIEKSKDARDWIAVKRVNGAGNSTERLSYSVVDKFPYSGTSYYRLKQTDYDGQFTYSNIRAINMMTKILDEIKIYPNPGSEFITLEGDFLEPMKYRLVNMMGKDVSSLIRVSEKSNISLKVDISRLPEGVYSIKTTHQVTKFIKK